jgi:glutathione peroxidase-family protein
MKKSILIYLAVFSIFLTTTDLYSSNFTKLTKEKSFTFNGVDTLFSTFDKIKLGINQIRMLFDKNNSSKGWSILNFVLDIVDIFVDDEKFIINKNGEQIKLHSPRKKQYQTRKAPVFPDRNY